MAMRPFGPKAHGVADWVFMAAQIVVPRLLGLSPRARLIATAFGAVTGVVNSLTRQPFGIKPVMSLRTHGKLETPLIPAMVAVPLIAGVLGDRRARRYFLPVFAIACVNYLLTDYNAGSRRKNSAKGKKARQIVSGVVERNPHHTLAASRSR
ncbi:MAG: hypothetical protein H7144_18360 [Burkholderiales bacterium]|nr:hypothetical protein [Phycisphaerae bacterium]